MLRNGFAGSLMIAQPFASEFCANGQSRCSDAGSSTFDPDRPFIDLELRYFDPKRDTARAQEIAIGEGSRWKPRPDFQRRLALFVLH